MTEHRLKESKLTNDDRRMLRLEANTWDLLQRVYEYVKVYYCNKAMTNVYVFRYRRQPHGNGRTAQEMLKTNPYTPPQALYNAWLNHSPRLAELCEVQKWLESTYHPHEPPPLNTQYWSFTRMDLTSRKRQGQTARTGYVRTLDPDALNRTGDAGVLNADDAEHEKAFLAALFQHVRAGRIESAAKICESSARPWRAAVVRGVYPLKWDGLEDLETNTPADKGELWAGNRRWLLWRQTCARAAMSVRPVLEFD